MKTIARLLQSAACLLPCLISAGVAQAGLTHRYSFSDGAKDSVGHVDGATSGQGATIADGKLQLKNEPAAGSDRASHVAFSAPLIARGATSATLVIWFTAKEVGAFSRLIDIGETEAGDGHAFIYFSPHTADDMSRAAITATDVGGRIFVDNQALDDGKPHMAALVFDGAAGMLHFYIDGKEPKPPESLGENTLDKVQQAHTYLGRSSFDTDPGLSASIDEFRVYDTALGAAEIAAISKAGPDALPPATQPAKP